jgi:hypothetical protein
MPIVVDDSKTMSESDFLELSLLLPRWQLHGLAEVAERRGMNVGQLLRRLIGNMLQEMSRLPE